MRKLFAATIERGQAAGEFRTDRSAVHLAEYVGTMVAGMAVTSKRSCARAPTSTTPSGR